MRRGREWDYSLIDKLEYVVALFWLLKSLFHNTAIIFKKKRFNQRIEFP